jgi:hypothetical protein
MIDFGTNSNSMMGNGTTFGLETNGVENKEQ